MNKIKCKVCGCEFEVIKDRHYISREEGKIGLSVAFCSNEEVKLYDTFDCPICGCQIVVQKRNRAFKEYDIENEKKDKDSNYEKESSVATIASF